MRAQATVAVKVLFVAVALLTATGAIFSAVLMTEPGQSLNLPRSWVVGYYTNRALFVALVLGLLGVLWWLHRRHGLGTMRAMALASAGVALCLVAANFLLALLFPPYQHGATYVPVADAQLADDQIVYAVTINGETKGFPRDHLSIPHIAGASIGGEEVVMTFCPLSNLPMVFDQDVGHGRSELGVLIQTHNNLVLTDRVSGELIQQITGRTEFSGQLLRTRANTMLRWGDFKRLYPQAEVFVYPFDRALDRLLLTVFEKPLERQFSDDHGPIFPTLALTDDRLPHKAQVWGVDVSGERAAFTRAFLTSNPTFEFELGGTALVMRYDAALDVATLFERSAAHGANAPLELPQVPLHNGVFWMVWAHWFPDTALFD